MTVVKGLRFWVDGTTAGLGGEVVERRLLWDGECGEWELWLCAWPLWPRSWRARAADIGFGWLALRVGTRDFEKA
jgi:hypothetical protein